MSFDVSADAYLRFMGRWSEPLADGVPRERRRPGHRAGAGRRLRPGRTHRGPRRPLRCARGRGHRPLGVVRRGHRARFPALDVRQGTAEALPYDDGSFDAALAQLVVHFMSDPVAGLRDMGRVTRSGGVVAACVWDHAGGGSPLSLVWSAAQDVDPSAPNEADLPGTREGQLPSYARAGRARRHHALDPHGAPALRVVRRVVGAVPLRCRPARLLHRHARRRPSSLP